MSSEKFFPAALFADQLLELFRRTNRRVTGAYAATSALSSNPLESCGLVFGSGLATASYVHTIGTEAAPVKVSGKLFAANPLLTRK